ncbi:ATP synthase subunit I [Acholeplasma vituli]|uniref:ATP synthase subunit I n=1 Tax=Paracholeplasma vituli TaxID=69473 RepID=A0ABT2PXN5_9MOLU|nr:ATP synthase subunit I [Paracholeplasma vituli]MCU0104467.1 ATP synthase subunit I [Paracholeplasma vituli]
MSLNHDFNQNFKYTIGLIGLSSVVAFFIFGREVAISIVLGGATTLWGMSHLAKQNRKLIQADGIKKTRSSGYIIRFLLYGIVLVMSHYSESLNLYGTFYGLMTFKICFYTQSIYRLSFGGKKHE